MDHRKLFHNGSKEFKNNFRIKYYLNNVNKKIDVKNSQISHFSIFDDSHILNETDITKKTALLRNFIDHPIVCNKIFNPLYLQYNCYFLDLYKYLINYKNYKKDFNEKDIKFIFSFGDNTKLKNVPCFVKAKKLLSNDYSVLLNLNTYRHTSMLATLKSIDIPFHSKINKVIWRGAATGLKDNGIRCELVKKYQNTKNPNIDIKFSHFSQGLPKGYNISDYHKGNPMTIDEMLKYKFLVSVEGNDVATNLKWGLLSNSVILQPIPTKCSWFMEDMLIPFEHFIPLNDDFSDLEEKFQWCMNNLDKCEQISKNATIYMNNFLDEENENHITNVVINRYLKNVQFV